MESCKSVDRLLVYFDRYSRINRKRSCRMCDGVEMLAKIEKRKVIISDLVACFTRVSEGVTHYS